MMKYKCKSTNKRLISENYISTMETNISQKTKNGNKSKNKNWNLNKDDKFRPYTKLEQKDTRKAQILNVHVSPPKLLIHQWCKLIETDTSKPQPKPQWSAILLIAKQDYLLIQMFLGL